ncbi:sulfatase [bacterium]|nr:sulfatase [bacterium]
MTAVTRRRCLSALLPTLLLRSRAWSASAAKPNILFVMIDTLRADHVGCYGYKKPTTPNLDRLAREGVRFADFHTAAPWTMPSVMTMFTSLHPTVHGATSYQRRASLKVTTLAERLKRLGYRRTAAITSNPTVNSRYGFAQGFDLYDDYTLFLAHELNLFGTEDVDQRRSITEAVTSHSVTQTATRWLEKEGRKGPWFLFLLYFDPHDRYVPPAPWDRRFDPHPNAASRRRRDTGPHLLHPKATPDEVEHALALYDGEIGYTDHHIGALLKKLDALGHHDDTLVLLVSDHGEEFLDHGGVRHGRTLYDEQTRGALMLRHPATLPAGKVASAPACHLDVTPTLLDAIGVRSAAACQGTSLLPLVRSQGAAARPVFLEGATRPELRAVVHGRHKLIRDTLTGREELYDLDADASERTDIASQKPALCHRLGAHLDLHITACAAAAGAYQVGGVTPRPKLTPRDLQTLRALGYLQ